ncbi:MAG TPA: AAA family ATPase, partial [Stellaceae bacterium]|nr:AAA family ATPase [Stellaceae bacterium]
TPMRTLWDARATARLTPLVNRESEFAVLRELAARAVAGAGRMVVLSGDAGSGKSRLVHEFLRDFRTDTWIVLRSGAMPFSINAPYAMPAMLLGSWLGLDEEDAVAADRLRAAVTGVSGRWAYPALCSILGIAVDDGEWRALDADARRRYTLDAVANWIAALCRERALLLVFEDLQWADTESAAVVSMLAARAEHLRLLIIATQRSGEAIGAAGHAHAMALRVEPLSPEAGEEMLLHLLGGDAELAPLRQHLAVKTGGVPFFLEETSRALAETGALEDTFPGYRRRMNVEDIRVPSNVQLVLASRIDRLPPPEKELLHLASVIGYDVPRDILQTVADLPEAEVEARLAGLERAGFLRLVAAGVFFEHMLTRDVAYDTLLLSSRRTLHHAVFEAMERRGGEPAHVLAHHAFQGELWPKALQYLVQAASRALDLSAYSGAIRLLEQALETLKFLPRSREFLMRGIDVRLMMRAALAAPTGDFARIEQIVREAKGMAVEIGDDRRLGVIAISEAAISNHLGDSEAAIAAGRLALNLAGRLGDEGLSISARIFVAQAHLWRGELAEARSTLDAGIDWRSSEFRHQRFGTTGTSSILTLHVLASANAFAGNFAAADKFAADAIAIAAEGKRSYDQVHAAWCRGWVLSYRGAMGESRAVLEEALRLCEKMQVRYFLPVIAAVLGTVHSECGRATEGVALLSRALATQRANGLRYGEAWSSALLGYAKLAGGDLDAAVALAMQALELGRAHGYGTVEVTALRVLAASLGRLARLGEANSHFDRAIARAEALGLRPELAHCRLERGLLLRDLARPEEARAELAEAVRLYAEMGMGFWQAKAVAALDEIGGAVRQ